MRYDFDRMIDRRNTNCVKYDAGMHFKGRDDLMPLWVADMDFALPEEVLDDLRVIVDRGVFGYGTRDEGYLDAVRAWYATRFSWDIDRSWIVQVPGVVFAVAAAIQAIAEPGDGVLIQQPVYHPFAHLIEENGCRVVNNELVYRDGRYTIDFDDFERCIVDEGVSLFILCSPHNPVGRVWTREELDRMGQICLQHGVTVVSDEIHCDFVYGPRRHLMFPTVDPAFARSCIVCTSPSKTFNIAGLQIANTIIPDKSLRDRYKDVLGKLHIGDSNIVAVAAAKSVYTKGAPWLSELIAYLEETIELVRAFVDERLEGVTLVEPEGTYLLWLDFSGLGLEDSELEALIVEGAGLWLNEGSLFGTRSGQFQRMNIACPRSIVEEALLRLERAVISVSSAG